MKKVFTLLLIMLSVFSTNIKAQTNCNLHAKISFERDSSQPNKVKFTNLSTPANDIHVVKWSFGDGTYSSDFNTSHVYTKSGLYKVCLVVKKNDGCQRDTCINMQVQVSPLPCSLTADFVSHVDSLQLNKIHFLNSSSHFERGDSIRWTFGDGSFSYDVNPTHIYKLPGTYNVCIRVKKISTAGTASCIKEICKQVIVSTATISCNIKAKFSFERDSSQPNKVKFTNLSTPANDIHVVKWSFGDGTYSSGFNASHVYTKPGVYTVCLIVQRDNRCYSDTCVKVEVRLPAACNLEADFKWHPDSSHLNKVQFVNLSSHFERGDSIRWTFGDGTSSNDVNPTHIYSALGTYKVCIRVKKNNTATAATHCVKEICKEVVVSGCRLEADFKWEANDENPNKIYFKNSNISPTAATRIQWTFGDGSSSYEINPVHTYAKPGTYKVCLKVAISNTCYKEICKAVEIKEREKDCLDISKFSIARATANCLEFKFSSAIQNPDLKNVWTFGDGTGSTDMNPKHVYADEGKYTVHLTVFKSERCASTSSKVAETGACNRCSSVWVKYEYKRESLTSNKIYFHALSNYPLLSQTWSITKLSISSSAPVIINQNNPVYVFNEPGDYRVCLKTITEGQCVKEYCEVIHISSPNASCTLTAFPNPAHNQISVNVQMEKSEMIHVYIFNTLNILVKQKDQPGTLGNNTVATSIEMLLPGWYTIKVMCGTKVCYSKFQKI